MDDTVVDGREIILTFITKTGKGTGTGTSAVEVADRTKHNDCVTGSAGPKILVSSGSNNDSQGTFPTLPPT